MPFVSPPVFFVGPERCGRAGFHAVVVCFVFLYVGLGRARACAVYRSLLTTLPATEDPAGGYDGTGLLSACAFLLGFCSATLLHDREFEVGVVGCEGDEGPARWLAAPFVSCSELRRECRCVLS
eukprot:RCo052011